jgi:REP element-mobilizing transposase RayT
MVTSTLRGRNPIFSDWRIGRLLVAQFREAQELDFARSLAWVVMPDHFHWMFELQQTTVNKLVQRVKSKNGIAVNKVMGTTGSIWQDGYHDVAVRREEDVVGFARYIVANPLRAGLVERLGDYPLWDAIWIEGDKTCP